MSLVVDIEDERWSGLEDITTLLERASEAVDIGGPFDVHVLLTNDESMRTINRDWRAVDKSTNVLAFPASASSRMPPDLPRQIGDIVLAYETISKEAAESELPVNNHISHLFVHGMLHLLGYDHLDDDDAHIMEGREREILAKLGIPDPYLP